MNCTVPILVPCLGDMCMCEYEYFPMWPLRWSSENIIVYINIPFGDKNLIIHANTTSRQEKFGSGLDIDIFLHNSSVSTCAFIKKEIRVCCPYYIVNRASECEVYYQVRYVGRTLHSWVRVSNNTDHSTCCQLTNANFDRDVADRRKSRRLHHHRVPMMQWHRPQEGGQDSTNQPVWLWLTPVMIAHYQPLWFNGQQVKTSSISPPSPSICMPTVIVLMYIVMTVLFCYHVVDLAVIFKF